MKENTLIILLNGLSTSETKEFKKFLDSPFFNSRADVCQLFSHYMNAESFLIPELNKEKLFENIYPAEPYNDAKLRHLLSYLVKLVKTYYAQVTYRSQPIQQQLDLQSKLKEKGLMRAFEKEWIKTERQINHQSIRNGSYYQKMYELDLQKTEHLFKQKRQGELGTQKIVDHILIYFVTGVLQRSCSILTHQKMSSTVEAFPLLDHVMKMVHAFSLEKNPAVAVYYYSILIMKEPEQEEYYNRLKQKLNEHWQVFPISELKSIYLIAINHCIQKINSGKASYVREAFDFYRRGLEKEVFLDDNILSPFTYKNILKLGVRLKEFDWIDQFLDDYRPYLDPKDRKNHYTYCRAVFYFNKSDYTEVRALLQKVTFKDKLYELDVRRMLLIIYYEQNEITALESLLNSFQVYIRRQTGLGYHKENYLNLIRFVRKFLKSNMGNKKTKQKLKSEIENTLALAERQWLLSLLKD